MSDEKEVDVDMKEETPEKKLVSRAKIRVANRDSESPIGKITIRQSTDSPQSNYEIISPKSESVVEERKLGLSPQVKLHRYEVRPQSPKNKAINNGLDPMAMELISSASIGTPKAASEYSDKSDESYNTQKISREMKNLQKSTNDSKILSNYLISSESPRSRRKNQQEPVATETPAEESENIKAEEEEEQEDEETKENDQDETEVEEENDKELADSGESDSTLVLHPMEPPEKRRKSVPRSRSRSRNAMRSRKKSFARQLKDELNVTSDKDEIIEDDDDDMSEVSFVSNPSLEGRSVKPPPKAGSDSFCFKCHTDTAVLSLACSKCKCSYHRHCVRPNPIPKNVEIFVCPECLEIETAEESQVNKYGHERIDLHTLAEMLTIILEKIRTYPDRDHFEADIVVKGLKEPSLPLIVTQMSLKTIESRIKMRHYKVSEAFIHDLKQLEHNWNIVDRSKTKTLKSILKYVVTEINELEACVYCYEESFVSGDWFIHPCKRPHLLIWAKLKGYPFWPAKVMSIDSRQQVDVRFFGAHDRAWVPSVHCMLFSEKDPNKSKGATPTNPKNVSKTQKGIADAMKEKDGYIENLRTKYGFKYAQFKQQLDPNNLQGQLEAMLPNLKNAEKDADTAQGKLTLKIIKGQSSNYQVEHKSSEPRTPSVKDKPRLYKVLSKNDDNKKEEDGKLHPLIIKRKSNVEQEVDRAKRSRTGSETSESNASIQSGKAPNIQRRKSTREAPKTKKAMKAQELPAKKKNPVEKNQKEEASETGSVDESTKNKLTRKRVKSVMPPEVEEPLLVPLVVPPGTDEIQKLKESTPDPLVSMPIVTRTKKRSQSYNRLNEKEPETEVKEIRRKSVTISSPLKRSISTSNEQKKEEKPKTEDEPKKAENESSFDPGLVIKDEPMSDNEELMEDDEQNNFTLNDLPELMQDKSGKRKVIVISTNEENGETLSANTRGRAKKSFPNSVNQRQLDQLGNGRNGNWMVCIPQAQVVQATQSQSQPPSNRSTPASESQVSIVQLRSNATSTPNSVSSLPSTSNRVETNRAFNVNPVPPLTYAANVNNRQDSVQAGANQVMVNGQHRRQSTFNQQNLPRLVAVPRPQGVFTYDGSNFSRDTGPVSRMFSDNAHRVTDFFRNVLIETVTAFAPEVPSAENLMLRAENEKLQREMQSTKSDCQLKMQELRREHQEEIESLKQRYEERIVNLQIQFDQEKSKLVKEVRQQCENDKQRAVEITRKETKKTTWCSNCTKEARFYCCWNTSYCGQQCQKTHWQIHQKYCTNKNSTTESQQQQQQQQQQHQQQLQLQQSAIQLSHQVQAQAQVQTCNDSQVMPVPVSRLVLRSPQHLQQTVAVQQHQPSIQQIILPQRQQNMAFPVLNVNQIQPNQIVIGQQQFKNNPRMMTIYPEKIREAMPQSSPTSLMVQTIQRNESPNINVISTQADPMIVRVNNNINASATPTTISQE